MTPSTGEPARFALRGQRRIPRRNGRMKNSPTEGYCSRGRAASARSMRSTLATGRRTTRRRGRGSRISASLPNTRLSSPCGSTPSNQRTALQLRFRRSVAGTLTDRWSDAAGLRRRLGWSELTTAFRPLRPLPPDAPAGRVDGRPIAIRCSTAARIHPAAYRKAAVGSVSLKTPGFRRLHLDESSPALRDFDQSPCIVLELNSIVSARPADHQVTFVHTSFGQCLPDSAEYDGSDLGSRASGNGSEAAFGAGCRGSQFHVSDPGVVHGDTKRPVSGRRCLNGLWVSGCRLSRAAAGPIAKDPGGGEPRARRYSPSCKNTAATLAAQGSRSWNGGRLQGF